MYLPELAVPAGHLKGVGPAAAGDLASLGVITVADLLLHLPRGYEDRTRKRPFAAALRGEKVNTTALIESHEYFGFGSRRTLKMIVRDESRQAELVCFGRNFLARSFPPGMKVDLAGVFTLNRGSLQSTAFEMEEAGRNPAGFSQVLPIYPLAGRLSQKFLRRIAQTAFQQFGAHLQDELPEPLLREEGLPALGEALRAVHLPASSEENKKPSMVFKDGYETYNLNGVNVTKEIAYLDENTITKEIVLTQENADIRREILRKMSDAKIVEILDSKVVDTKPFTINGKKNTYELLNIDINGQGRVRPFLKMDNPSLKGVVHIEGVEDDCKTVEDAIRFRNGLSEFALPVALS